MRRTVGDRRRLSVLVSALALGSVIAGAAVAGPGALDRGFGGDGKVTTDFGANAGANAVATLRDGSIVAAGRRGDAAATDFALAKYRPNGSPDPTFGGGDGEVTANLSGSVSDRITDLLVDPDRNLVVSGITDSTNEDFAIGRFEPDGDLDTTFNPGGAVPGTTSTSFTTAPDTTTDHGHAVVRNGAGNLIVAGSTEPAGGDLDAALARFLDGGTLDPAFSPGAPAGRASHDISGSGLTDLLTDVAVLGGGDIMASGYTFTSPTTTAAFVARFTAAGDLHPTYGGGDGVAMLDLPSPTVDAANSLVLQADGSALIGGSTGSGLVRTYLVGKFRPNGTLDPSFGGDGSTVTHIPFGTDPLGAELVREPNGRITLVGMSLDPDGQFMAARYLPNGKLDRSFSRDGVAVTDLAPTSPPQEVANAGTLARSGAIVAAGYVEPDFALAAWQGMPSCFGWQPTLAAYPGGTAGGPGSDVISGDRGRLKVRGRGGSDRICGGPKKDKLKGQGGNDKLKGGRGNDLLTGSGGNDVLNGGPGKRDVCRSGAGNDKLKGCERSS